MLSRKGSYIRRGNVYYQRRQWQPTPVVSPGKSHGRRSLVGCSPSGRKESDTTERVHFPCSLSCIGEGNGTPLQCSCLENPKNRGALVGCNLWDHTESDTTERLHFHFSFSCIGEGKGNPLQYSCLENPRDGSLVDSQSRTRLT